MYFFRVCFTCILEEKWVSAVKQIEVLGAIHFTFWREPVVLYYEIFTTCHNFFCKAFNYKKTDIWVHANFVNQLYNLQNSNAHKH